jgi:ABC-type bacteriocin/lantibiotic exporter with double-glycine peptidase domain
MEAALFMRIMQLPVRFFRDYSAGDLAQRVQRTSGLSVLITESLFGAVVTALMALLYTFQMVDFGHALALPALGVVLLTALISICSALLQIKYSRRCMEYEAKASGISFALISGIHKLRIAGAEKRAFSKWANVYAKEAEASYDPPLFLKIDQAVIVGISLLGTMLMYYIAVKTGVTPSEYLAFASAFGLMQSAYMQLSNGVIMAAQIRPTLDMAEPILKAKRETGEGRSIVTDLNGIIEMAHVSFRYD